MYVPLMAQMLYIILFTLSSSVRHGQAFLRGIFTWNAFKSRPRAVGYSFSRIQGTRRMLVGPALYSEKNVSLTHEISPSMGTI